MYYTVPSHTCIWQSFSVWFWFSQNVFQCRKCCPIRKDVHFSDFWDCHPTKFPKSSTPLRIPLSSQFLFLQPILPTYLPTCFPTLSIPHSHLIPHPSHQLRSLCAVRGVSHYVTSPPPRHTSQSPQQTPAAWICNSRLGNLHL